MNGTNVLVVALLAVLPSPASAGKETKLREISWAALGKEGRLASGLAVHPDGSLLLDSTSPEGLRMTLVEIENPGVTANRYVVRGRIRYTGVAGEGFLEMWSFFEDGSHYFSRTLDEVGPMQKIRGTSDWRDFGLYFDATGATTPLQKLTIGIVLPGAGEAALSDLTLVQLEGGMALDSRIWGGVAGAGLGCFCALLGTLAGVGRGRTFVLVGLRVLMAAGLAGLAVGVFLRSGNYPMVLLSAIALAVSALSFPAAKKRYEELELRRMHAMDV
jgi:hypothetical protein